MSTIFEIPISQLLISECPCGGDCTAGCEGCENPICKPSKAVLMLSTYKSSNVPMVIDYEGSKTVRR